MDAGAPWTSAAVIVVCAVAPARDRVLGGFDVPDAILVDRIIVACRVDLGRDGGPDWGFRFGVGVSSRGGAGGLVAFLLQKEGLDGLHLVGAKVINVFSDSVLASDVFERAADVGDDAAHAALVVVQFVKDGIDPIFPLFGIVAATCVSLYVYVRCTSMRKMSQRDDGLH